VRAITFAASSTMEPTRVQITSRVTGSMRTLVWRI
jgi:hypothetical protein